MSNSRRRYYALNSKGKQIAEESQLLAEERFIIDSIKKIRTQRNGLQIERLQLESMLAEQKFGPLKRNPVETQQIVDMNTKDTDPSNPQSEHKLEYLDVELAAGFEGRVINEELCNVEELNLTVTQPMVANAEFNNFVEEEEDEYSSAEDDILIDFMTETNT